MRLKRWLFPIFSALIFYTICFLFICSTALLQSHPTLSAILTVILVVLMQAMYIIPTVYYAKYLQSCKNGLLFVIYQALIFCVPILIETIIEADALGASMTFVAFTVTFILGFIGWLAGKANQKQKQKNEPYTAQFENVTMDDNQT